MTVVLRHHRHTPATRSRWTAPRLRGCGSASAAPRAPLRQCPTSTPARLDASTAPGPRRHAACRARVPPALRRCRCGCPWPRPAPAGGRVLAGGWLGWGVRLVLLPMVIWSAAGVVPCLRLAARRCMGARAAPSRCHRAHTAPRPPRCIRSLLCGSGPLCASRPAFSAPSRAVRFGCRLVPGCTPPPPPPGGKPARRGGSSAAACARNPPRAQKTGAGPVFAARCACVSGLRPARLRLASGLRPARLRLACALRAQPRARACFSL